MPKPTETFDEFGDVVITDEMAKDPRPRRPHRATGRPVGRPKGSKPWNGKYQPTAAERVARKEGIAVEAAATLIEERRRAFKALASEVYLPEEESGVEITARLSGNGVDITPSEDFINEVMALALHARRADEIAEIISTIVTFDTYTEGESMVKLVTWMRDLVLLNGGWVMEGDRGTLSERISFTKKLVSAEKSRKKWLNQFDANNSSFVWTGIPVSTLPPQRILVPNKKPAG